MGAASFSTKLKVKGTKEECLEIMKVLYHYANERYERYIEKGDCWYLDKELESPEKELEYYWKAGEMSLSFSGPYGVMNGLSSSLFEKISDVAPESSFIGDISGFDPGANYSMHAELKDGLLYLRDKYEPFGNSFDEEESEEETMEDSLDEDEWDGVYDPKTKKYTRLF